MPTRFLWALFVTVSLAACGGNEDAAEVVEPESILTLKDATFAGKTSAPDLFAAVVTHAGGVTAYFCDGSRDFWFRGLAVDSAMEMTEASGASVVLEVTDEAVVGRLKIGDAVTPFEIPRAPADSLYRAETYMGGQRILGGWIRLPGGEQRGVIRNVGAPVSSTLAIADGVPVATCSSCDAFAGALVPAVFDSNAAVGLRNKARHDFTVIGLGDSFMSGEGAPVRPGLHFIGASSSVIPETWSDGLPTSRGSRSFPLSDADRQRLTREARACHRGAAGLTLAVDALRGTWPASVDIIHQTFACSGAAIEHLLTSTYSGPANCPKFAAFDPNYAYCLLISDDMPTRSIRPQVTEAVEFMRKSGLKADAVVMSIGGNDLGFGAVIADCLTPFSDCGQSESKARIAFDKGLEALPGRYQALADRLVAENIPRSNVFLTSHPNPLRSSADQLCAGGDFAPDLLLMNLSAANAAFGSTVHAEQHAKRRSRDPGRGPARRQRPAESRVGGQHLRQGRAQCRDVRVEDGHPEHRHEPDLRGRGRSHVEDRHGRRRAGHVPGEGLFRRARGAGHLLDRERAGHRRGQETDAHAPGHRQPGRARAARDHPVLERPGPHPGLDDS